MSSIRKATIQSSIINYIGFGFGAINIYFFVNLAYFTPEQYGLTRIFIDLGVLGFSLVSFGVSTTLLKFSSIYQRHHARPLSANTELLQYAALICLLGFVVFILFGFVFRRPIQSFFSRKSLLFVTYDALLIPYVWGVIFFTLMEYYFYTIQRAVILSFFKELIQRVLVFVCVMGVVVGVYDFNGFMYGFASSSVVLLLCVLVYFWRYTHPERTMLYSDLTKRLRDKIISFSLFSYAATVLLTLASTIDSFLIAGFSKGGLADAGVFTLGTFIISIMQVPQKHLNNIASVNIYKALQLKQMHEVKRIYYRSSLNLFIFSLLIFLTTLLVFDTAFDVLPINPIYRQTKIVIVIMGLGKMVDMLTSVNVYIINGSRNWRYDLYFNVVLFILSVPFNYLLIKAYGIMGAALTNTFLVVIINTLRCWFIYHRFRMHPFHLNFIWISMLALALFVSIHYGLHVEKAWLRFFLAPSLFVGAFLFFIYVFRLSPDLLQLIHTLKDRYRAFQQR